ncbi:MAG: hypothetical protein CO189_04875 [candidate division Zixibacteria bacterium CG_4_9_14_3_um_filter_46_8]|nr:MAG: hypothetical protein CO189_04875 [candidate division Zixibacteria bacterium CG_4_9_14_3_um_filter_46_8]
MVRSGVPIYILLFSFFLTMICCDEKPQVGSSDFSFLKERFDGASLERISDPERFPAESLWVYIDGAADLYLKNNVLEMAAAYYTLDQTEVNAEVYRFDDSANAMRMFHSIRPNNSITTSYGKEGFKSPSSIEFVQGNYLVRLIGYDDDAQTQMALNNLAENLDKLIPKN